MTSIKLTLAIADKDDFRDLWKLYKLSQQLEQAWCMDEDPDTRARRCRWAIAERVQRMQSSLIRIGMGCEMLIREVCDPSKDSYALKPVVGAAPEMLAALYTALPFIEDAMDDPTYNPAKVALRLAEIKAAIAKAEGQA